MSLHLQNYQHYVIMLVVLQVYVKRGIEVALRKTSAIVLCVFIILLSSCIPQPSPKSTVRRLEKSIQQMDVNGIIDCFEPKYSKGMRAVIKLAGGFLGVDGEAIFDLLPFLVDISAAYDENVSNQKEYFESIKIEVTDITYNEDKSEARVAVTISAGGESQSDYLDMVKDDGKWYIAVSW